jgi:hypothetical protein
LLSRHRSWARAGGSSHARHRQHPGKAPSNASCADKAVGFPVLGEEWLGTTFDKHLVQDPSDIGKSPLKGETWTSVGTAQFTDEKADNDIRFEMLQTIRKLFGEHGITYWLSAGTLLGTYRHGTLIPWDDDGDVVIPYEQRAVFFSSKVVQAFKNAGLQVRDGMFCHAEQYNIPNAYLKRYVRHNRDTIDMAELKNDCDTSSGFFSRIDKINGGEHTHIDVWNAFPVTINDKTLFSIGLGNWLFSRQDVLPVKPCWLKGVEFTCPARTKLWLTKEYDGNLKMPYTFDTNECKLIEPSRKLAYASKWNKINVKDFPYVPQLYIDEDDIKMHLPFQYEDEVVQGDATLTGTTPPAEALLGRNRKRRKLSHTAFVLAFAADAELGPLVLPSS